MNREQQQSDNNRFVVGELSEKALLSWVEATARLNIWEGAVRSGKTVVSILRWLEFIKQNRNSPADFLMIGKTQRTLKRNILDTIEKIVGKNHYRLVEGAGEVYIYGRKVYIVGANDERAQDKIRGMTLVGAYGDELTIWAESFFKMLLTRLSVEGASFFGTTNPDSPYHWLRRDYLLNEKVDLRSWHFRLSDNLHLPKGYLEALENEFKGLWHKRFIEGLWVMAEGAVYDMWDEEIHVKDLSKTIYQHYGVSIDYGTNNPCTFGLYGWDDDVTRPVGLISEWVWDSKVRGRTLSDRKYADQFIKWLNGLYPEVIFCDPSAASFITELRDRGYIVTKANNDVLDGIRYVSSLLSDGLFEVDESCEFTIEEFGAYVWDNDQQKVGIDEVIKKNDHAMDRNRYFLYTQFGQFQAWSGSDDNI